MFLFLAPSLGQAHQAQHSLFLEDWFSGTAGKGLSAVKASGAGSSTSFEPGGSHQFSYRSENVLNRRWESLIAC